jgi:hypothetical protein
MEETVEVSLRVHLAGEGQPTISQAVRDRIRDAIAGLFVTTRGRLLRIDVETAIRNALNSLGTPLRLAENDAVALRVLYKESGRILNNIEEVSLEENEVLRLKEPQGLEVSIPGALDV